MPFHAGDQVRLVKLVDLPNVQGPVLGTVGKVIALAIPGSGDVPNFWRVQFDDFVGEFRAGSPPGLWFVTSDEIELL
jgi:hypothetical protein